VEWLSYNRERVSQSLYYQSLHLASNCNVFVQVYAVLWLNQIASIKSFYRGYLVELQHRLSAYQKHLLTGMGISAHLYYSAYCCAD